MTGKLYETLGVSPNADAETIKKAHRRKVKKAHPDAGGSAEAFNEVSRAYMVLSDADKRAHYDRTGDAEAAGSPENAEEAEAMNVVAQHFCAVLGSGQDPKTVDVIKAVRHGINQNMAQCANKVRECGKDIVRLEEFAKRLQRPEGVDDKLGRLIDGQIMAVRQVIAQAERVQSVHKRALGMVEGYAYRVDAKPAARVPMTLTDMVRAQMGTGGWSLDLGL